jgi:hypothetical protein
MIGHWLKSYNSALEKYCTFPQEKMDQLLHGNCAAWLWKKLLSAKMEAPFSFSTGFIIGGENIFSVSGKYA